MEFRPALLASLIVPLFAVAGSASAAPTTLGNVLVTNLHSGVLTEYTPQGQQVQHFNTPDFSNGWHDLRGVAQGSNGLIHMFNGTFIPQLTTLNPSTGNIVNHGLSGWSTVNNQSFGGVGVYGDKVFASDMFTFNGGEQDGIVVFDLAHNTSTRIAPSHSYIDLAMGRDGFLYATTGGQVDVYNPNSNALVRSVQLPGDVYVRDIRAITADKDGNIYAASWYGDVVKLDAQGNQVGGGLHLNQSLTDIDINNSGDIVLSSSNGRVFFTTSALDNARSFQVGSGWNGLGPAVHVAFSNAVPEPETWVLMSAGLGMLGFIARRRKAV